MDSDLSGHMTDWYLVRWLLDLYFLETHKLGWFDLENELSFDHVFDALLWGTFQQRSEGFAWYHLVDFETAGVACILCHLDAWDDSCAFGDDTLHVDEGADLVGFDIPHLDVAVFLWVRAWDDAQVVVALQLCRNLVLCCWSTDLRRLAHFDDSLGNHRLSGVCRIKSSLLHHDVKRTHVFLCDNDWGLRHVLIDHIAEKLDVSFGVCPHTFDETLILCWIEEILDVIQLNFDNLRLLIGNFLQLSHVLQLSMDRVFIRASDRWILESSDEILALCDFTRVIWDVKAFSLCFKFHFVLFKFIKMRVQICN